MKKKIKDYEESSGNVFQDLGLKDPENENLKAQLALQIFKAINDRKLTQEKAAKILEVTQPEISKLKNGHFSRFGIGRLFTFLNRLNYNVDIQLNEARNHHPHQKLYA